MTCDVKYFVKIDRETAYLAILGRASYMNCKSVDDFFNLVLKKKCTSLFIDFAKCAGMDSTFMGMLAGVALKMIEFSPESGVTLFNLSGRNLDLIENLGLNCIVALGGERDFAVEDSGDLHNAAASKKSILRAHKNLVEVNSENQAKFQDVIVFLQGQAEGGYI